MARDAAIHYLLAEHTVAEAQRLQVALGQIRRASGDYPGKLLVIDPHRMRSYSKRQMRRYRGDPKAKPYKVAPTFFALDPDTHQPVCFTTATSARTATTAAIELLGPGRGDPGSAARPNPGPGRPGASDARNCSSTFSSTRPSISWCR